MAQAVQWTRSAAFGMQMYLVLAVLSIVLLVPALVSRRWAFRAVHLYCGWVRWTARWMLGLATEVRGSPPTDAVMIAAKHQSFLDILVLASVLPRPRFVMKRSLTRIPVFGWYARRIGCVPVDRGRGGRAVAAMLAGVARGRGRPAQLVIYPQGTRVAPHAVRPYKAGAGAIYEALGQDCVPVATNVGLFWPRGGVYRRPGLGVVAFLPRIAAGRPASEVMAELERQIEAASERLMAEAGG